MQVSYLARAWDNINASTGLLFDQHGVIGGTSICERPGIGDTERVTGS
jgi:hypothetical protein